MKKRISYKSKWLHAEQARATWQDRADAARRELQRICDVLATEGQKVSRRLPIDGEGPILLTPLELECVGAFIRSNARYVTDWAFEANGDLAYSWRDRPLLPKFES